MNIKTGSALLLSLFILQTNCVADVKDRRTAAIAAPELRRLILQTPINSPLHQELMSRAGHSHLLDVAYAQYTQLWRRKPGDAYANLLRGVSAEYLELGKANPDTRKFYSQATTDDLLSVAASSFERAIELDPKSAIVNLESGYFLWQFGNKLPQGLAQLRKASQLEPNDVRVHAIWGLVYENPLGGVHNMKKAVDELNLAIKLDPTYAYPHSLLAGIYTRLKQPAKAEQERVEYQSLLP